MWDEKLTGPIGLIAEYSLLKVCIFENSTFVVPSKFIEMQLVLLSSVNCFHYILCLYKFFSYLHFLNIYYRNMPN